jgi:K+-transporting ATPase ATPase C chain
MLREIRPATVFILTLTLITGVAYPFAITGLARVIFPTQAEGSLIERDGQVVGSALIGQVFTGPGYFHGRPSATVAPDPNDASKTVPLAYNAANSGGSNLGPTSKALAERMQADVAKLKHDNASDQVPTELVTTSGSGLDPHISPAGALFQVSRVAKTRNMPDDVLRRLITEHTEGRTFGIFGEPRVNVLALNLALDRAAKQ